MGKLSMDRDEEAAERIRARMAELRSELSCDVQEVGRSARAMTDVGHYVRRFPWATVAIAAALGYLLVPRKKQVVYPDRDQLAKLIKQNQVRVETGAVESRPTNIVKSLLAMGLMTAARVGMNSVAERLASAATVRHEMPGSPSAPAEHETWST
jgi:hypothetical protein